LVLTGHSLGGMYASLLLFGINQPQVLELEMSKAARALITSATAVTFGAPMVFGHDPAKKFPADFVELMKKKYVNYMNENDPCPRAWSELDLDEFLDAAQELVTKLSADIPYVQSTLDFAFWLCVLVMGALLCIRLCSWIGAQQEVASVDGWIKTAVYQRGPLPYKRWEKSREERKKAKARLVNGFIIAPILVLLALYLARAPATVSSVFAGQAVARVRDPTGDWARTKQAAKLYKPVGQRIILNPRATFYVTASTIGDHGMVKYIQALEGKATQQIL